MHRTDYRLCTQGSLLVLLEGPYGELGTEPHSAMCKASTLPTVPLLQLCLLMCPSPSVGPNKGRAHAASVFPGLEDGASSRGHKEGGVPASISITVLPNPPPS